MQQQRQAEQEQEKEFALPPASANNRRVFAYLLKRGISRKALMKKLETNEKAFALLMNVTHSTVRLWTTGAARPCSMARRLMQIYESGPEIVSKIAGESCPEKGGRQTSEAKEQTASCGK